MDLRLACRWDARSDNELADPESLKDSACEMTLPAGQYSTGFLGARTRNLGYSNQREEGRNPLTGYQFESVGATRHCAGEKFVTSCDAR